MTEQHNVRVQASRRHETRSRRVLVLRVSRWPNWTRGRRLFDRFTFWTGRNAVQHPRNRFSAPNLVRHA